MIDPLFCEVPTVTGSDDKQLQRELGPKCLHFSIHPSVLAAATAANRIAAYIILTHGPNIISFGRGEYIRLLPSTSSHHVLSSSCPVSLFLIPIWLCLFSAQEEGIVTMSQFGTVTTMYHFVRAALFCSPPKSSSKNWPEIEIMKNGS